MGQFRLGEGREGREELGETEEEKGGETERRDRERKRARARETDRGGGELAKLLLTAMGPPDNPGILSEINLSTWGCCGCHYTTVPALSQ